MAVHTLDTLGLKCPQPILKLAAMAKEIPPGDTVEILSDCHSFPNDLPVWCAKAQKTLILCVDEGGGKFKAQVQF